eukprot:COSAG05_NODE_999_length_6247_cov_26.499024_1_plen_170_part_10
MSLGSRGARFRAGRALALAAAHSSIPPPPHRYAAPVARDMVLVSSPRWRGLLLGVLVAQELLTSWAAAPVVGRHHHHSVRIGALPGDNSSSSVASSAGDGCDGDPLLSIAYTADGQCNTLDAGTCSVIAKSPECSYIVTVDGTVLHIKGIWAGTGCHGTALPDSSVEDPL